MRCVLISSGFGVPTKAERDDSESLYRHEWSLFQEESSRGRFTQISVNQMDGNDSGNWRALVPTTTTDEEEHGIEVDVQTLVITLNRSSVQSFPTECATDPDVMSYFGHDVSQSQESNLQVAIVDSCVNRMWYRIIGRDIDVQSWTPDARMDGATPMSCEAMGREYSPHNLFSSERWIIPIFEPIRRMYMTFPTPWDIRMREAPLSKNAMVAYLVVVVKEINCVKEILVHRHHQMVQVYDIKSYGRRFYRSLVYTTDTRMTFFDMQPPSGPRSVFWSWWQRHEAGSPSAQVATYEGGRLILKAREHPENYRSSFVFISLK